jgi:hypothetical protein
MTNPIPTKPDLNEYRFALYCHGHLVDLANQAHPPVALYRDDQLAHSHGATLWPATYAVVDLLGDDRP